MFNVSALLLDDALSTYVVLFQLLLLRFQLRCGGIFSDSTITNFPDTDSEKKSENWQRLRAVRRVWKETRNVWENFAHFIRDTLNRHNNSMSCKLNKWRSCGKCTGWFEKVSYQQIVLNRGKAYRYQWDSIFCRQIKCEASKIDSLLGIKCSMCDVICGVSYFESSSRETAMRLKWNCQWRRMASLPPVAFNCQA